MTGTGTGGTYVLYRKEESYTRLELEFKINQFAPPGSSVLICLSWASMFTMFKCSEPSKARAHFIIMDL